jgi:hypothetical protein
LPDLRKWQARAAQEKTAELNRKNAQEEASLIHQPVSHNGNGRTYWVLKEEEVEEEINR